LIIDMSISVSTMKRQAEALCGGLPVGVTAKERARPASVAVAGSIPAISTEVIAVK